MLHRVYFVCMYYVEKKITTKPRARGLNAPLFFHSISLSHALSLSPYLPCSVALRCAVHAFCLSDRMYSIHAMVSHTSHDIKFNFHCNRVCIDCRVSRAPYILRHFLSLSLWRSQCICIPSANCLLVIAGNNSSHITHNRTRTHSNVRQTFHAMQIVCMCSEVVTIHGACICIEGAVRDSPQQLKQQSSHTTDWKCRLVYYMCIYNENIVHNTYIGNATHASPSQRSCTFIYTKIGERLIPSPFSPRVRSFENVSSFERSFLLWLWVMNKKESERDRE